MLDLKSLHDHFINSSGVCTDTRKIVKDSIFFALKGGNFDGNKYAQQALDQGCKLAVVDDQGLNGTSFVKVENVEKTLQDLANYHRQQLDCPVLALTGSNGKTTTKELITAVLQEKYSLNATKGNLNNHLGVPFTLLETAMDSEFLIVEMGANHQKEIDFLCRIAEPDFGLICNIGKAHLEGFGGIEGVKKGKTEMYHYLNESDGVIFYNSAEKSLVEFDALPKNKVAYGTDGDVLLLDHSLIEGKVSAKLSCKGTEVEIQTQLHGEYNLQNILTAAAIGVYFEVPVDKIKLGIEAYVPQNNRSEQRKTSKGNLLILDAYNANPTSMGHAVDNMLKLYQKDRLLFLLGDMKELGEESKSAHWEIANKLKLAQVDAVLAGPEFSKLAPEFDFLFCEDVQQLAKVLSTREYRDRQILIKGSRGIALEKIVDLL